MKVMMNYSRFFVGLSLVSFFVFAFVIPRFRFSGFIALKCIRNLSSVLFAFSHLFVITLQKLLFF